MNRNAIITRIELLAFLALLGGSFVYFLFRLRRWMVSEVAARLTRAQHSAFEARLREMIFKDPFRYTNLLCSKEAIWFVRTLWEETGDACAGPSLPAGNAGRMLEADGSPAPHPIRLPADGLSVDVFRLHDGMILAVVTLPPPELTREAYLIGILLPPDPTLAQDIQHARRCVRYFVLNKWPAGRDADFCEWKPTGSQLTYNIGAPKYPAGFAKAIEARRLYEGSRRIQRMGQTA